MCFGSLQEDKRDGSSQFDYITSLKESLLRFCVEFITQTWESDWIIRRVSPWLLRAREVERGYCFWLSRLKFYAYYFGCVWPFESCEHPNLVVDFPRGLVSILWRGSSGSNLASLVRKIAEDENNIQVAAHCHTSEGIHTCCCSRHFEVSKFELIFLWCSFPCLVVEFGWPNLCQTLAQKFYFLLSVGYQCLLKKMFLERRSKQQWYGCLILLSVGSLAVLP